MKNKFLKVLSQLKPMENYLRILKLLFTMAGKKESFLLVSLNESKAKELAQVITNDTCRSILDYLADNEATESVIAKELNLPISTVHYNLQQLMKGSLVVVDEFHYSEKGKEVNHYKLANKYIIIAPKTTWGLKEKLKKILPIAGLVAGVAFAVEIANRLFVKAGSTLSAIPQKTFAEASVESVMDTASPTMSAGADMVAEEAVMRTTPEISRMVVEQSTTSPIWQHAALWFLIGGMFAIITYLFIDWLKNK